MASSINSQIHTFLYINYIQYFNTKEILNKKIDDTFKSFLKGLQGKAFFSYTARIVGPISIISTSVLFFTGSSLFVTIAALVNAIALTYIGFHCRYSEKFLKNIAKIIEKINKQKVSKENCFSQVNRWRNIAKNKKESIINFLLEKGISFKDDIENYKSWNDAINQGDILERCKNRTIFESSIFTYTNLGEIKIKFSKKRQIISWLTRCKVPKQIINLESQTMDQFFDNLNQTHTIRRLYSDKLYLFLLNN